MEQMKKKFLPSYQPFYPCSQRGNIQYFISGVELRGEAPAVHAEQAGEGAGGEGGAPPTSGQRPAPEEGGRSQQTQGGHRHQDQGQSQWFILQGYLNH